MPGVARQLYLPYGPRRLIKPRGLPLVLNSLKPRGLILSAALADASFKLAYCGDKFDPTPNYTSSPKIGTTPKGMGLALATSGGATCVSYAYNGQPPTTWSMEVWAFVPAATFSGTVCGFNQNVGGNSSTFDRQIADAGGGVWSGMLFDGGTKTASTGISETALGLVHFVATTDGSNLRAYGNGKLNTTTGVSNGGFTGYSTPAYFCIGSSGGGGAFNAITPLLVNYANVCWTDQEVLKRYTNPFGFLRWPEDRRHYLVGVASGPGTQNLAPGLLTNTNAFFSPTVAPGAVALAPGLFTDPDTFFGPTITTGPVNLIPSLFTDPDTFFSPTVTVAGAQALAPSLFTNQGIFYLPVVRSHIVLVNVWVRLTEPHEFSARVWPKDTVFGPDQATVPSDFNYTPLMEGYSAESQAAIAQVKIDVWGRYDSHGNLLDNPPLARPIWDPQPTPAVGTKHLLPLGNQC